MVTGASPTLGSNQGGAAHRHLKGAIAVGLRKLTKAEVTAYTELARAARKLRAAQRAADAARRRARECVADLSLTPTGADAEKKGGARVP
jgi:hypothetical protein